MIRLALLALLALGGAAGLVLPRRDATAPGLTAAARKNLALDQAAGRLRLDRRVADVIVVEQTGSAGAARTTFLFVERGRDGTPLPARHFTLDGDTASFRATVLRPDPSAPDKADLLRGHHVLLFTRVRGKAQPPDKGFTVDAPGEIPDVYRGPDPRASDAERELWAEIWKRADGDPSEKTPEAPVALRPDRTYTLTLRPDGTCEVSASPLRGPHRDALRRTTRMPALVP